MSKLHKDYDHCLELDHGELNEIKSYQYWVYEPGHEVCAAQHEQLIKNCRISMLKIVGLGIKSVCEPTLVSLF